MQSKKILILKSVLEMFKEQGSYEKFTISEVAKRADIGKSTVYEYFENKEEIFKEACLYLMEATKDEIIKIDNIDSMGFEEAFKIQVKKMLVVSSYTQMTYEIFVSSGIRSVSSNTMEAIKKKGEKLRDNLKNRFMNIMLKGIEEGKFTVEDFSSSKNTIIRGLVIGCIFQFTKEKIDVDVDDFVDQIYKSILKII